MTALIAIDWGTTSFRAWALDRAGRVLAETRDGSGILKVPGGDLAGALERALAALPCGTAPVIASGMITSRNGWVETPYLPLPLDPAALAAGLVRASGPGGRALHFVPGAMRDGGATPDVMRGEETEIAGLIASGTTDGLVILPGTHSKLARLSGGRLVDFRTCMTGEVFALLADHSILGRLMAPATTAPPGAAFRQGLAAARDGGPLLSRIFAARSLALFDRLAPEEIRDFLSGLLIGDEIGAGLAATGAAEGPVTVVGRGDLAARYRIALEDHGRGARVAPEGCARRGLHAIAHRSGIMP